MIITCPDCATSYELPDTVIDDEGKLVQCEECRTIWTHKEPLPEPSANIEQSAPVEDAPAADMTDPAIEPPAAPFYQPSHRDGPFLDASAATAATAGSGVSSEIDHEPIETLDFEEIPDDVPGTALVVIEAPVHEAEPVASPLETINVKSEAARLARASASAKLAFQRKRQNRMRTVRGWGVLAASVVLLTAPAVAFPRHVTVMFPAAAQLYAKAGVHVNTRGLEFREISYRRVLDEGALVLEIEGKVVNVSEVTHELAPLHVALLDDHQQSLYSWTLKAEPGTVQPEGAATFKTRLAAPPSDATNLRVRFALPNETR